MQLLFVIHCAVTWALVGLIWTIQVVHYPLLQAVGREGFVAYHARHMALITWVVGPLMLTELGTAVWLLYLGERSLLFATSLAALALNWGSTRFCQVPLHQALTQGYDRNALQRLVRSNIWRTTGWTVRGICLAVLMLQRLR